MESVVIHGGSAVFNGSFVTLMPAMLVGATYILMAKFDAEKFIETVQRNKATHVIMVPSQLIAILNAILSSNLMIFQINHNKENYDCKV